MTNKDTVNSTIPSFVCNLAVSKLRELSVDPGQRATILVIKASFSQTAWTVMKESCFLLPNAIAFSLFGHGIL